MLFCSSSCAYAGHVGRALRRSTRLKRLHRVAVCFLDPRGTRCPDSQCNRPISELVSTQESLGLQSDAESTCVRSTSTDLAMMLHLNEQDFVPIPTAQAIAADWPYPEGSRFMQLFLCLLKKIRTFVTEISQREPSPLSPIPTRAERSDLI